MRITSLIEKKKLGMSLTDEEIRFIIRNYTNGEIADYHMSALAMAICFNGMNDDETASLTYAMAESGDQIDLSEFGSFTADKHSTGGVGDKTSLIIAPIVASLGAKVAKMSGRGLGHTGGTIDKLEAIPGYNTSLSFDEFIENVRNIGIALVGSSKNLAPADKKLYALRDVTATVDSIPLIASSVMSKKIASSAKNIVLDVKCGSGAFMKTYDDARQLAEKAVSIGKLCNRNIAAIITDMDTPLGNTIGNALEVKEAIDVLKGGGPDDLRYICIELAAVLLELVFGGDWHNSVVESINNGNAYEKFKEWINSQGGNIDQLNCASAFTADYVCKCDGYIASMDSKLIGECAMILGAGRTKVTDIIDHTAGIILKHKTGDYVKKGDIIATLQTNKIESIAQALELFEEALKYANNEPAKIPIIYTTIR